MSARRKASVALVVEEFVKLFIEPLGTQELVLTLGLTGRDDDRMQSMLRDSQRSLVATAGVPSVAEDSASRSWQGESASWPLYGASSPMRSASSPQSRRSARRP